MQDPYVDTGVYENRKLAVMPKFEWQVFDEFPELYENYINDHIPFRNQLIRICHAIDLYLFKTSTSNRVAIGDDGWLFYIDKGDGNPISNYKGQDLLSEDELAIIASNLIISRDNLQKEGCEFIVFIAPNRERIYSEYMPRYYGEPAQNYGTRQIVNYLRTNTDIRVVFPVDALLDAKEVVDEDVVLYHKTDTHWNELGAYVGTRELLLELGVELPRIDSEVISIIENDDIAGDMVGMLNMKDLIDPGKTYTASGYEENLFENEIWDFPTEIRYHAIGADLRKIFVNRDSFCTAMSDIIGSQFNDSIMVHRKAYNNDYVRQEEPDIYVLEVVERSAAAYLSGFLYE